MGVLAGAMPKANTHCRNTIEGGLSARCSRRRCGAERRRAERRAERRSRPVGAGRRRRFRVRAATQQVGEATSASFLAPYRREDSRAGYEAFLADIVAVAQRFGFELKESPGRDEPRLRGLRQ